MFISFFSFSFGCRVNQAEKEKLDRKLISQGLTYSDKNPDLYIINSCAVTQKAEREVRQKIYQIRKKYPQTKIIITGCAATYWKLNPPLFRNFIESKMSGIFQDKNIFFIPNNQKDKIPEIILNSIETNCSVSLPLNKNQPFDPLFSASYSKYLQSGRLLIKIQDGCNRYCSYCIVPYLRGKSQSRKIDDIIREINLYCRDRIHCISVNPKYPDIHEVILTAINTEAFGKDNGESFLELIKRILEETKVEKISFGSIHPLSITDEFLNFYQKYLKGVAGKQGLPQINSRLVPFFHIPIQSGSNKILKLMNRGYTTNEILIKLKRLHEINPEALIATDIIVGFPEETDEDFEETINFLKKSPIRKIHVFRYSKRIEIKGYKNKQSNNEISSLMIKKRLKSINRVFEN